MASELLFLVWGGLGGLCRSLVGLTKQARSTKRFVVNWQKAGINIVGCVIIGAVVGFIIDKNPLIALSVVYAGIDLIENVVKIKNRKN